MGIRKFLNAITPFIIGFVIAYFLNPPYNKLRKWISKCRIKFIAKAACGLSVLLIYLTVILIIVLVLSYVLPFIGKNITELVTLIPQYYKNFIDYISNLNMDNLPFDFEWQSVINSFSIQEVLQRLSISISSISGYALEMTSGIINTFISIVASIYMLLYKERLLALINRIVRVCMKEKSVNIVKTYMNKINEIFYKFISTQFLDACILGTLATMLLSVIGIKYSVTLGILLGVCNMIPYFGSIFASTITVIVTIFTDGFSTALVTGILLTILQQIDGNVISPKLMGFSLKINPIWIIFAITVEGSYFGVIGMFLSVPVIAMLKVVINNIIELREKKLKLN